MAIYRGNREIAKVYRGNKEIIAVYRGSRLVHLADVPQEALLYHFDAIDNTATGIHDPTSSRWIDLKNGAVATLQNATFKNQGVLIESVNSKVAYPGQNVQAYTIFSTHKVLSIAAQHPRVFGEHPYPTMYLQSNHGYSYALYAQGKDTFFSPQKRAVVGETVNVAMRWSGIGQPVEFFLNGVKAGEIPNVTVNPGSVSTMYIGANAGTTRTIHAEFYEHLVYSSPLSDSDIDLTYQISRHKYKY